MWNPFNRRRDSLTAAGDAERDASDERWWTDIGGSRSEIDVHVTIERARKVPVVHACLALRSESVAGLETGIFRRVDARTVERADDHPVAQLMVNPNPRQTSYEFWLQAVDDLDTENNFYAEKIFDTAGNLVELWRIEPEGVTVEELRTREKRFRFHDRWGKQRVLLEDEVWHIPAPPLLHNLKGLSTILHDGREAVAVAIALQRYANILFANDATPPYGFTMDGSFDSKESRDNWIGAWRRRMTGKRRHEPAVLEYGIKPHRLGLTAEEAQFLETRKELWLDLARLWRVPPHKVGILDKATFSNIEHQGLEFVTDTLRPILELIERSVTKCLIDAAGHYVGFTVDSLLRGDLASRYTAYSMGRQWGWLSVNDILRMERRNGIGPAGDRYVEPLNMVPVGTGSSERERDTRQSIDRSIALLRQSVARNGGRPRLELVKDAA